MPTRQVISALLRVSCLYLAKISIGKDKPQDHDWQIYGVVFSLPYSLNVMLIVLSLSFSSRHYELKKLTWNVAWFHSRASESYP